ncbi:MAG: F0F1 ATP synthase subunit delta [Candidatus Pacebacteria bacterium]|nr:F0F1 ATP synthase subunit delta [Candidatus Paceibacterota bacterium]
MKITPKQYAISLYEITRDAKKEESSEMIKSFVDLLRFNNNLSMEKRIVEEYQKYCRKQKGISKVRIKSGEKLSPEIVSSIVKHFAGQVELEEEVEPNLIGGISIEIDDDTLIDGSVRKKLENLRQAIG